MVPNGASADWCRMVCVDILSNLPKGGICRHSSNHSHGIRKIGNKLVKGKIVLDDESLTVTASRFVEYLKEVKRKCGVKPILVFMDETDFKDTFKETLQFINQNLKRKGIKGNVVFGRFFKHDRFKTHFS